MDAFHSLDYSIVCKGDGDVGDGWTCDVHTHTGSNLFRSSEALYGCENILSHNWGSCAECIRKAAVAAEGNEEGDGDEDDQDD